jgi:hypothetical protein
MIGGQHRSQGQERRRQLPAPSSRTRRRRDPRDPALFRRHQETVARARLHLMPTPGHRTFRRRERGRYLLRRPRQTIVRARRHRIVNRLRRPIGRRRRHSRTGHKSRMRRCNGLRWKDPSPNPERKRLRPNRSLNSRNPRRSRGLIRSPVGDRVSVGRGTPRLLFAPVSKSPGHLIKRNPDQLMEA